MLDHLEHFNYQGKPLTGYSFYLMGQICIHPHYRGKGIFDMLYQKHKEIYSPRYELLVTEISTSNYRSQKAHERVGFKTIHTYKDAIDEWNVVVWEW
jgi:ribosomal protein S18 acetylase RimI-like enzyme